MPDTAAPTQQNKNSQAAHKRAPEPTPVGQDGLTEFYDPGLALMLGSSADQQAQLLANPAVQARQRQTLAARNAVRLGNRSIQRMIADPEPSNRRTLSARELQPLPAHPASATLARQNEPPEKKKVDAISPEMFTVTSDTTFIQGEYTTERKGSGDKAILVIHAPRVDIPMHVHFNGNEYEFNSGDGVKVGPVQVVTSASRIGVYMNEGKEVARFAGSVNNARDTLQLSYNDPQNTKAVIESPFYNIPQAITNDTSFDVDCDFYDRPSAPFPIHFGGGTLARIEGADNFNVSTGIKQVKTGQVLTINPQGWRANWSMNLDGNLGVAADAEGKSTARGVEVWQETVGQYRDSAANAADEFANQQPAFTFLTVIAAMHESAESLWIALAAARAADPASVVNIEAALRAKDPTFRVTVRIIQAATGRHWSLSKSDAVSAWANAGKQSPDRGPVSIEEGQSSAFDFKLNEIMDPSTIDGRSQLTVWAGGNDPSNPVLGDSIDLAYPFFGGGEIAVSAADQTPGRYAIRVSMA